MGLAAQRAYHPSKTTIQFTFVRELFNYIFILSNLLGLGWHFTLTNTELERPRKIN